MIIGVRARARLHFGLLRRPTEADTCSRFGGIGLAIGEPTLHVRAGPELPATTDARALDVLRRLSEVFAIPRVNVVIDQKLPEHCGFGSGTQLSLAFAVAATRSVGLEVATERLADVLDRGRRSLVGVHAFSHGGFVVDAGAVTRWHWPAGWSFVLVTPETGSWSGERERRAFAELPTFDDLGPMVQDRLIPALQSGHFESFAAGLAELNARAGDAFASIQGGRYSSEATARAVRDLRDAGAAGAGQSSWGPTAWGLVPTLHHAERIADELRARWTRIAVARGSNSGAVIRRDPVAIQEESM